MKTFILLVACLFGGANALSCFKGGFYNGGATYAVPWATAVCATAETTCVRYEATVTDTETAGATTQPAIVGVCATACPTTCGTSADLVTAIKNGATDGTVTSFVVDSTCKIQCCTTDNCNQFGSTASTATTCPTVSGASSIESGMLLMIVTAIAQRILA